MTVVHNKAARLIREGSVHATTGGEIYIVQGDNGTYLVAVLPILGESTSYFATCNCEAGRADESASNIRCSHATAAIKLAKGEA